MKYRTIVADPPMPDCKRHKHTFSALWYHFGPYGDQNVHVHPCWAVDCWRVLIGPGRDCDGDASTHWRETLRDTIDLGVDG